MSAELECHLMLTILKYVGLECASDEFECVSSGVCISKRLLCDSNEDCPLGEDEAVCPSNCNLDQFR